MTHTPGPYKIKGPSSGSSIYDDGGDYAILALIDGKSCIIAETFHHIDYGIEVDAQANAALIAAAPDLLAACEAAIADLQEIDNLLVSSANLASGIDTVIEDLEAVIAKAKGCSDAERAK